MVDEIHYIADEERGATLEATVVRMKSISAWRKQTRVGKAIGRDIRGSLSPFRSRSTYL